MLQGVPGALLKTINCHLAVPNASRQRVLLPDPVLVHGAQRPAPEPLRFPIVRLVPESLQLQMIFRVELLILQDFVQRLKVAPGEGYMRLGPANDGAASLPLLAAQRRQEPAQLLDVPVIGSH